MNKKKKEITRAFCLLQMSGEENKETVLVETIPEKNTISASRSQIAVKQPRVQASSKCSSLVAIVASAVRKTKGLGSARPGAKRHAKVLRDNIQGITAPALRRLARRGGVKRMNNLVYEDVRLVLKMFIQDVVRDAVLYTEHANRKTVTPNDVVYALKRQGRTLYGYGSGVFL